MSPRGLAASSAVHGVLLLLLIFGLPSFLEPEPMPQPLVMSVEILPISEMSNVDIKSPTPKKKEPDNKPLPEVKKEPPKKEEIKKEEVKKEPEKKPEPKPEPIPDPVKKEEPKKEDVKKETKKEEAKQEEKKDEKKKEEEPSLDDILKDLKKDQPKTPPAPKTKEDTGTPKDGPKSYSDKPFDQNSPAAMALQDSIRNQIMPCWLYQGGAPEDKVKAAKILVSINPDGTVASAKLATSQMSEYSSNGYFKAIVDSAIRATRNPSCTPLKNLPQDQYHMWKELVVTFDPRLMM